MLRGECLDLAQAVTGDERRARPAHPEQQPQSSGPNSYTWEVSDSPAVEIEPEMPPWSQVEGHMIVKYFPTDPKLRAKTSGSWNDIALWYQNLIAPRRVASPEIKAKVAELTAGVQDPLEKIRRLAAFTQRQPVKRDGAEQPKIQPQSPSSNPRSPTSPHPPG